MSAISFKNGVIGVLSAFAILNVAAAQADGTDDSYQTTASSTETFFQEKATTLGKNGATSTIKTGDEQITHKVSLEKTGDRAYLYTVSLRSSTGESCEKLTTTEFFNSGAPGTVKVNAILTKDTCTGTRLDDVVKKWLP